MEQTSQPRPRSEQDASGCTSQERKRHRRESKGEKKPKHDTDFSDFDAIPTSLQVMTGSLRKQLMSIACRPAGADGPEESVAPPPLVVPTFKVGTLEMYRRFPEAYEAFMNRHDCSQVRRYILDDVVDRIVHSSASSSGADASPPPALPFVRVADFGCGTGRMEVMVAQHPAVAAIAAYDGEAAMLRRCLVNTVDAARRGGHHSGARVVATASETPQPAESVMFPFADGPAEKPALEVVARPCAHQALQAGFLPATGHRRCQLVLCAWSLSYLVRRQWGEARWHAAVDAVVGSFIDLLDTSASDAAVVVLETLGNGTATPARNNTLTQRLEEELGFSKRWVRTDYTFADDDDAARMTRFFFGEKVAQQMGRAAGPEGAEVEGVARADGKPVLMECTGIWTYWKRRGE